MTALLTLPDPAAAAGAALSILFGRSRRVQRTIAVSTLTAVLVLAVVLLVEVDRDGPVAIQAGRLAGARWASPWWPTGCRPSCWSSPPLMLLAVLVYAIGQPGAERNHVGFQSVYLVLAAGVAAAFLTGDLFNLFVVHRDDAHRQLRADHAGRSGSSRCARA